MHTYRDRHLQANVLALPVIKKFIAYFSAQRVKIHIKAYMVTYICVHVCVSSYFPLFSILYALPAESINNNSGISTRWTRVMAYTATKSRNFIRTLALCYSFIIQFNILCIARTRSLSDFSK